MIQNTDARDSDNTRWWILAFVSLLMFGNYYVYDAIGPLAEQLERLLGFSDTEIGALNAIYSLPNIFLVLIGGLIAERHSPNISRHEEIAVVIRVRSRH